jgi:hypothetical protein
MPVTNNQGLVRADQPIGPLGTAGGDHLPLGASMVCRRVTANLAPGRTCQGLTGVCLINGVRRARSRPSRPVTAISTISGRHLFDRTSKAVYGAGPTPHPAKDGVCTDPFRCGTDGGTDRELALKGAESLRIGRNPLRHLIQNP